MDLYPEIRDVIICPMNPKDDWIWEVLACPESGDPLLPGSNKEDIICSNPDCQYRSVRNGRIYHLLPRQMDQRQLAENEFRLKKHQERSQQVSHLDEDRSRTIQLLNIITNYPFSSLYKFFRDTFSQNLILSGRGLELGGATGQLSGFIRIFFPNTQIVMTDIAPINVMLAEGLARRIGFETDYYITADAERLPFKHETFDFLVSSGMLHHLGNLPGALEFGFRVLRPGGRWYIVNELSIGKPFGWFWDSRFGKKGRWAKETGIRERSYSLKEWLHSFHQARFRLVSTQFHTDPQHKLSDWKGGLYYAFIHRLPRFALKLGIPSEINFVLEK